LRLAVTLIVLGCVLAARVSAASGADAPATAERAAGVIGPRVPTIAMPTLVAPVLVSGELHHYVFLSVTLQLTRDTHKGMMLEKIPYLQDAFLREVHGPAIVKDNDPTLIDEDGLKQRLLMTSATVVGAGIVNRIELKHIAQAVH
jgi:hypothetical protein